MGFVQRRLLKGVLWVVSHPRSTLVAAAIILIASIGGAMLKLRVSTDQNNLFSPRVKFFADYLDFDRKFPENQAIYVLIEPRAGAPVPPVARWVAAADAVAGRLKQMMPRYVSRVDWKIKLDVPAAPGILFQNTDEFPHDVRQMSQWLGELAQVWGESPSGVIGLFGKLASAPTPMGRFLAGMQFHVPDLESARFVRQLADSWLITLAHPDAPVRIGHQVPDLAVLNADDPSQLGYYYEQDRTDPTRHMVLVRVYGKQPDQSSLSAEYESVDAIRGAVNEVARNYPEFELGVTGRPVLDADEMKITDRDSHRSEVVALAVVFVGLVLLLRSVWLAVVAEASLAVAIGWTFGWATVSVGELNLLSIVFLIALIGIGMDYLIQILAAYRREARRYVRQAAIWARVFRYVGPPIVTACLGAAGAFFVSVFTQFRGAADLGIIAGGGLLLCLLAGYTVLPAVLVLLPAKLKPYPSGARYGAAPPRTRLRLALPCLWFALVLAGIPFMLRAQFNPNLLDLQAPNLRSVQLVNKLQTWSAVVLSPDLGMLRKVRDAVKDAPAVAGTESILTAFDNEAWLNAHAAELPRINWTPPAPITPADLAGIAAKARGLAGRLEAAGGADAGRGGRGDAGTRRGGEGETRGRGDVGRGRRGEGGTRGGGDGGTRLTTPAGREMELAAKALRDFASRMTAPDVEGQKIAAALSHWQDAFVGELRSMLDMLHPPPLKVQNIPAELREHLASSIGQPPGQYLYALYIEPKKDLWNRQNLAEFETQVEARVASVPGAPAVTGITSDIYHTTSAIERAFYQATAYALALIFVLVLIDLRNLAHTLIAVSVLALGLPMLVALMGLFGVSWNFANFFGLPILIGAGHEYGVFMMHRYKEALHNPRRVWRRWDPADRALLLCAFVTSSSFGFFWALGHHKGLRSLGLVMAVGIACIYLATILVVRPLLTWHLEHRRLRQESREAGVEPIVRRFNSR